MVSTSVRYTPEAGVSCLPLASARVLGRVCRACRCSRVRACLCAPRVQGASLSALVQESRRVHAGACAFELKDRQAAQHTFAQFHDGSVWELTKPAFDPGLAESSLAVQ